MNSSISIPLNQQEHIVTHIDHSAPPSFDPPEPFDDAEVEPFDRSNEDRELTFCSENADA